MNLIFILIAIKKCYPNLFMLKISNNQTKFIIISLSLILILIQKFNLFYNSYIILREPREVRLIKYYGYCSKESFGFVNDIYKKYKFMDNIRTYNFNDDARIESFFFKNKIKFNEQYFILLNFDKKNEKHSNNLKTEYNISSYKIIEFKDSCYLIKKYD